MTQKYELTVLIPCLNEAETLETCIQKAQTCIKENNLKAEILIADNGSDDGSQEIAKRNGARVIDVPVRGYGAALIAGIKAARGEYTIMADGDDSYDFGSLMPYIKKLRAGYDLVMGNRFLGGIEPGAMPASHRYLGTPVLSFLGRLFFHNNIGDYNCGMRGFNTAKMQTVYFKCTGMEFASEMVAKCSLKQFKIAEVPTPLKKDGRSRAPYLRTWNDGWRHLKFMLTYCPMWAFQYPSYIFTICSLLCFAIFFGQWILKSNVNDYLGIFALTFGAAAYVCQVCYEGSQLLAFLTLYRETDDPGYDANNENFDKGIFRGMIFLVVSFILALLLPVNSSVLCLAALACVCLLGVIDIFFGLLLNIIKEHV